MKYRKRPVVIDAIRWTPTQDDDGNISEVLAFVGQKRDLSARYAAILIDTLEGQMVALPGDWIIRGVQGEHYPCKPDIFEATYEPVGNQ